MLFILEESINFQNVIALIIKKFNALQAFFAVILFPSATWESLPESHRNNPLFTTYHCIFVQTRTGNEVQLSVQMEDGEESKMDFMVHKEVEESKTDSNEHKNEEEDLILQKIDMEQINLDLSPANNLSITNENQENDTILSHNRKIKSWVDCSLLVL